MALPELSEHGRPLGKQVLKLYTQNNQWATQDHDVMMTSFHLYLVSGPLYGVFYGGRE